MGYYNPILAYGMARAVADAAAAGADGFIVVDLPPEEATEFVAACRRHDMALVPLVAPTTPDDRIATLAAVADDFLYCVSVTGTTGARESLPDDLPEFIARIRAHTDLPLAVGFGIKTREHVKAVGAIADAAIIGSAIIAILDAAPPGERAARVRAYVEEVTGHERTGASGPKQG
jgi:tryptophan synthase